MKYDLFSKGVRAIRDNSNNFIGMVMFATEQQDGFYEIYRLVLPEQVCLLEIRNTLYKFFSDAIKGINFNLENNHPIYGVVRTKIFAITPSQNRFLQQITETLQDITGY